MWNRITRDTPFADALTVLPLNAAKEHLRYEDDDQDATITGYIEAAAAKIDGPDGFGISLVPATWTLSLDRLARAIQFPLGPVTAVNAITYRGETLDASLYEFDLGLDPLVIQPVNGWGVNTESGPGYAKINVTAGYAETPPDLVQLMRWLVGHYFENREAVVLDMDAIPLPMGADAVIAKYTRGRAY